MAQKSLDQEVFFCPICLDLLKDPVTIPCGHSYCKTCVQNHWDHEEDKQLFTCPECRERFSSRPVLVRNILVASLVEQLKVNEPTASSTASCSEEVLCDVCTGERQKAVKSCLQCVASFCESHLQPHQTAAVYQRHQLVAPSGNLQQNICSQHNKLLELFCRTDNQLLCSVCVDQHKGHSMVSSATERAQREAQLPAQLALLLQGLQHKETDLDKLKQEAQDIRQSAQTALQTSRDTVKHLVCLLEKGLTEVEQQIQSEQETQLSLVKDVQDQLQEDIMELRGRISKLNTLSQSPDHNQFILHCLPSSSDSQRGGSSGTKVLEPARIQPGLHRYFEDVATTLSALREKIQDSLEEGLSAVSLVLSLNDVLLSPPLTTRDEFLQYALEITLDPNTASTKLRLSNGNRKAIFMSKDQGYPDHPDRFSDWCQVLSRESLYGCCYLELERKGPLRVAVTYIDIQRKGGTNKCLFGCNDKSWALHCESGSSFSFNSQWSELSAPAGSRLGVYLDHSAGVLSFYNVSQTMSLIHRAHTTFTQPLYVGVWVGDTVHFPKLK